MYQDLESSKSNAQPIIDPLPLHVILSNSTSIHCCSTPILPNIPCPNNRPKNINNTFFIWVFYAQGSLFGLGFLFRNLFGLGFLNILVHVILSNSTSIHCCRSIHYLGFSFSFFAQGSLFGLGLGFLNIQATLRTTSNQTLYRVRQKLF
jgi:hypothetical protein